MTNEETFLASLDKAMEKLIYETVLFGRQHPHQGTARYGGGCPKRQGTSVLDFLESRRIGINLTGANYVIHLDPWWNPAIEQQATDRAYRIGQNQKLTVYHLIAEHTIEEKILRLHQTKQSLADSLLKGTNMSHKLTTQDLMELLG